MAPSTVLPDGRPTDPLRHPLPAELLPPTILGYTEVVKLNDGGMGVVYRARHVELGRLVALKMIHAKKVSAEGLQRFRIEAKALARVQHPHIVQVHGWETTPDGSPVLAMEYVPGQTLKERLKGPLPPIDAARLVAILARAVQAAHAARIVHRDLKPANVLMAAAVEGNAGTVLGGFPKVSDFGLARMVEDEEGHTLSGAVMGTPAYMAPEQAIGSREVGPAADVWALGVILFQCVSGELPFVGDSVLETLEKVKTAPVPLLRERVVDVPPTLEAICRQCLDREASNRPSAAELAKRLERFADGEVSPEQTSAVVPVPCRSRGRASLSAGFLVRLPFLRLTISVRWKVVAAMSFCLAAWGLVVGVLMVSHPGHSILQNGMHRSPEDAELKVRLRVTHVGIVEQNGEKMETGMGEIGVDSFAAGFGDGVRLEATLSEPGYAYLVAFNADGKEQLLWPVNEKREPDEAVVPPQVTKLTFPTQKGKLFYLDDDQSGGMQVFAVLASRQSLPSYAEWKQKRGNLPWRKQRPGTGVWIADREGTYPRTKGRPPDRGTVGDRPGMPPLTPLARALHRGSVEQVEMLSFPVMAKEAGR